MLHEPTSTYAASTYTDGSLYNPASGFTHESWLFEKLLGSSRILEALLAAWGDSENVWLVGPEIFYKKLAGSTDEAWVREGRNAERSDTPMHQDTRVIPYYGEHLANVWISFEELPEENSLQVRCAKPSLLSRLEAERRGGALWAGGEGLAPRAALRHLGQPRHRHAPCPRRPRRRPDREGARTTSTGFCGEGLGGLFACAEPR